MTLNMRGIYIDHAYARICMRHKRGTYIRVTWHIYLPRIWMRHVRGTCIRVIWQIYIPCIWMRHMRGTHVRVTWHIYQVTRIYLPRIWRIQMRGLYIFQVTRTYVPCHTYICATHMMHSYAWYMSLPCHTYICAMSHIHMCHTTHTHASCLTYGVCQTTHHTVCARPRNWTYICVTGLISRCDMAH